MASIATESLVRQIGSLFDGTSVAAMSDRQLLDRFTTRRDAAGRQRSPPWYDATARWC